MGYSRLECCPARSLALPAAAWADESTRWQAEQLAQQGGQERLQVACGAEPGNRRPEVFWALAVRASSETNAAVSAEHDHFQMGLLAQKITFFSHTTSSSSSSLVLCVSLPGPCLRPSC